MIIKITSLFRKSKVFFVQREECGFLSEWLALILKNTTSFNRVVCICKISILLIFVIAFEP